VEPVRPGIWKERIVFGPANTRGHIDRWQSWRFSLHHGNTSGMRSPIMGEAAGEIAGLHEVICEDIEHLLERFFSICPMREEMSDVGPAALPRSAHQLRCHVQLIERLIPDLVQPVGCCHAWSDTRIDKIEEEQSDETIWCLAGERQHRGSANVMADDTHVLETKCIQERQHIRRMITGPNGPAGFSLSPKPRRSGAIKEKWSAKRVITRSQVNQNSGHPWSSSDLLPFLPSFMSRVCSGYAPSQGELQTRLG